MPIVLKIEAKKEGAAAPLSPQTFLKDEVTVGRGSSNDVILSDPLVSSKHAKLSVHKDGNGKPALFVIDSGSSNGTFLEDRRLPPNLEMAVQPGQRLIIGAYLVVPEFFDAEATSAVKVSDVKKAVAAADQGANANGGPAPSVGQGTAREQEFRVKSLIREQLVERLDLRRKDIIALSESDLRNRALLVIEQILVDLRWEMPAGLNRDRLIKQVLDEALGLGPLEELLAEDECSEIMVNRYDQIYAERGGQLTLTEYRFTSEQAVLAAIERILAPIGRRIDESSPLVDARLKDGSRVNAVIRPLTLAGPCITIRKFPKDRLTIERLVKFKSISQGMADFLRMAVEQRLNIVISGGTGSGKTTLLNIVSAFIPQGQRIITVEDAAELRLPQEHVIAFETRPPNLEGKGAITIRDLVKNALRMRPDRIIVGECRGSETLDMLQAMNTGHDGSMTTGHSNSPADMVRRLETMVLTAGLDLPVRAIREQIASAVNIILQQTRFACGTRKITAITEVVGMDYDEGTVQLQDVFLFRQDGYDQNGKIRGVHQATGYIPKFFRKLQERGLPVNAEVFSPGEVD